jgi:predicted nucleic acid-binding protein
MIFLDSNIFIIDRFFPRDQNYSANRTFLERLEQTESGGQLPYYTLLEICGVISFNLSDKEQRMWLYSFAELYNVSVLDPFDAVKDVITIGEHYNGIIPYIMKKMTVGDAIFLREAELYSASAIVTWNIRHFSGRTNISLATPANWNK